MVLNDFQRGKLPYFLKPPGCENEENKEEEEKKAKELIESPQEVVADHVPDEQLTQEPMSKAKKKTKTTNSKTQVNDERKAKKAKVQTETAKKSKNKTKKHNS
jgi:hypothetical protein